MPLTEDHVREELKKVIDPELFVNIVDLGLIYTVDIKPHEAQPAAEPSEEAPAAEAPAAEEAPAEKAGDFDVAIEMTMTSPMCPAGPQLIAQSKAVVGQLDDVADVEVKIVLDPPWTPERISPLIRSSLGL